MWKAETIHYTQAKCLLLLLCLLRRGLQFSKFLDFTVFRVK